MSESESETPEEGTAIIEIDADQAFGWELWVNPETGESYEVFRVPGEEPAVEYHPAEEEKS